MNSRPEQFQNRYKRNWRQQKCDSFGECYESHGLQRNLTKQSYEKPTQHVIRREKSEHIITTGMIAGKRSRGKQREKMLDGQTNWPSEGIVTETLKAMRDRDAGRVMIAYAKEHAPERLIDCVRYILSLYFILLYHIGLNTWAS